MPSGQRVVDVDRWNHSCYDLLDDMLVLVCLACWRLKPTGISIDPLKKKPLVLLCIFVKEFSLAQTSAVEELKVLELSREVFINILLE